MNKMENFKCTKLPLKYVLKNQDINLPKITTSVIKCHKIVVHALMFMKLYLLDYFEKNDSLPTIDKKFVNACLKTVCTKTTNTGRPPKLETVELKNKLKKFYNSHYKKFQKEDLDHTHLNEVLDYLSIDIVTMYENNIKLHYIEYVQRYVNVIWKNKTKLTRNKLKKDILESIEYKSKPKYHKWINSAKEIITPNREYKKNIYYDLKCQPQDYLVCMLRMMKEIEDPDVKIFNVFPIRNDIVPKSIKLDTTSLVYLLLTKDQGVKNDFLRKGNLKNKQDKIWDFFFRTERKCFKKTNYNFHHMITTNGISCSILFSKKGKVSPKKEKYIDELDDYSTLQDKKIVAYDPNMGDLIYCVDKDTKEANEFRYTQNSRRKECKIKKYAKIILGLKKDKVIKYETELSQFNRKTLIINDFKEYIKKKCEINKKLYNFYEKDIFRKLQLHGYINRKRNEQKMINNFKKIYGPPKELIIVAGDYEQKKHMKYKEPVKGKSIRNLFRQAGYSLYLADEFRTSCRCSNCGGECKKFITRPNPKPFREGNILVHGAVKCTICQAIWNRDVNAATNIYKIAYAAIHGKARPTFLSRLKIQLW